MKSEFWAVRVSSHLDQKVQAEAKRRDMNLSEFVRYAVMIFFDQRDDSIPQNGDSEPEATA